MFDTEKIYAVLTGDLVKSSRLTAEQSQQAMEHIRKLTQKFANLYSGSAAGQVDTFRHDSWQWLLADPSLSLRAALFIRAGLRATARDKKIFDTRIAIGIGSIDEISGRRISDWRGMAFTLSGRALDSMENKRLVYAESTNTVTGRSGIAAGLVPLLDCIVTDWTAIEAKAVNGALMGWTQEQIAENWPPNDEKKKRPTRQAVQKSLQRAHWSRIEEVLQWVESRNSNL